MKPDHDDDLAREIRGHLDLEAEERIADGDTPEEARHAAHRAFGNITRIREEARAVWIPPWADHLRQDLRYAGRLLTRSPGFAAIAILTLALGIGANTAIFTVVNAVLLRPLPFPGSDRIVRLFEYLPPADGSNSGPRRTSPMVASAVAGFRSNVTTLSHVGVHIPTIRTLTGRAQPVRLIGTRLSPDLLAMLRTQPRLGRLFQSQEDAPGAEAVVILSHATWQRYFAGDPNVIGQSATLDGRAHTIVGVMPEGFSFLDPQDEFWMPLPQSSPLMGQRLPITARLRDGASAEAALGELDSLLSGMRGAAQDSARGGRSASPFALVRLRDLVAAPVKQTLIVLAGAVGFVLLIACVNVANLLLARAAARQRELALRLALGAGRARLIRQALTESTLLALLGGAAGIALAFGGVALLRRLAASLPRRDLGPGIAFPRLDEIAVDGSALTFTLAVAAAAGVVFGLIPALRQSRSQPIDALRQGTASAFSGFDLIGRRGIQGLLVVAEIALTIVLFVGGGLLIHSFVRMSNVNPGYDPDDVLTFQLSLAGEESHAALKALAREVVARIEAVPGVIAAGYAEALPMTRVSTRRDPLSTSPQIQRALRRPQGPGPFTPSLPDTRLVSSGFLTAMGIKTIAGRPFGKQDGAGQPRAMLVNRTLARSGFLGENPIGRHVYTSDPEPFEIVGIVEDVRQVSLIQDPEPQIFIDFRQVGDSEPLTSVGLYFGVRIEGDWTPLAATVQSIVRQLNREAIVENIAPMEQLVSNSIARPRLYAVLLGVFAGVAVTLAAVGIYGVMACAVTQRTREIGVRMALGAARRQVIGLVLGQSLVLVAAGIVLGLGGAAVVTRYLEQLLFGLTPLDPATFAAASAIFAFVALIAAFIPARRAAKVDPLIALRAE